MQFITVRDTTTGITIGAKIALADNSLSRLFGLLGRRRLEAGEGLLIRPSSGIHTIGMLFPIDVVALDKKRNVLRLWRSLRPFRVTTLSFKTHSMLELSAGHIDRCGIATGHQLDFL